MLSNGYAEWHQSEYHDASGKDDGEWRFEPVTMALHVDTEDWAEYKRRSDQVP